MSESRRLPATCAALAVCAGVFAAWRYVVDPCLTGMRDRGPRWVGVIGFGDAAWLDLGGSQVLAVNALATLALLAGGVLGTWANGSPSRQPRAPRVLAALWLALVGAAALVCLELFASLRSVVLLGWSGMPTTRVTDTLRTGGQSSLLVANGFLGLAVLHLVALIPARRAQRAAESDPASAAAARAVARAGWAGAVTAGVALLLPAVVLVGATVWVGAGARWRAVLALPIGPPVDVPFVVGLAPWLAGPCGTLVAAVGLLRVARHDPTRATRWLALLAAAAVLAALTSLLVSFQCWDGARPVTDVWTGPLAGTAFGVTALLALHAWLRHGATLRGAAADAAG